MALFTLFYIWLAATSFAMLSDRMEKYSVYEDCRFETRNSTIDKCLHLRPED